VESHPDVLIELTYEPIDEQNIITKVRDDAAGCVVTFTGTVRNHHGGKRVLSLRYEAYETMAAELLRDMAEKARERLGLLRLAIVHRLGSVAIGDTAVVIAVSAAHRAAAFEACRQLVDALKDDVPIWKLETTEEGSAWLAESRAFNPKKAGKDN